MHRFISHLIQITIAAVTILLFAYIPLIWMLLFVLPTACLIFLFVEPSISEEEFAEQVREGERKWQQWQKAQRQREIIHGDGSRSSASTRPIPSDQATPAPR